MDVHKSHDEDREKQAACDSEMTRDKPGLWARLKGSLGERRDQLEMNWRFIDAELHRTRLLIKVAALHLRYTFGYLAFGFLISAPIQLILKDATGQHVLKSLILGGLCLVPFMALYPLSKIDWGRMRIPEFKHLELALTRWAAILALLFLIVSVVVQLIAEEESQGWLMWLFRNPSVASVNLGLMFFAWLRVKFHTLMFREFYTLKPDDDLVLHVPPSQLITGRDAPSSEPNAEAPVSDMASRRDADS